MKEIQLTQGKVALVDDEDFEFLNQWKWHLQRCGSGDSLYAARDISTSKIKKPKILMHRLILDLSDKTVLCDHKDGNGLNNQRFNLRPCTRKQNQQNMKSHSGSSSKYVGVSWRPNRNKFRARIFDGKEISLGHFVDEKEAAAAYNAAAIKIHGEFANSNVI